MHVGRAQDAEPAFRDRPRSRARRRSAAYSRTPRNVKLLATSHSRNWVASAISSTGSGGGLFLISAISSPTRASIGRQSCTHSRTSSSTAPIALTICVLPRLVLDALDMDVDEALAPRGADRRAVAAEADQRAGVVALDREDRMQHQADVEPLLGQLAHHRVEQERHVVVDDLDDRDRLDALRAHRARPRPRSGSSACRACAPAGTARRLRRDRRARAARSARDPRATRRRTAAATKLSGMSPRRPLRMVPACSISRRAARSSSLPNCGWMFMLFSPAGEICRFERDSPRSA